MRTERPRTLSFNLNNDANYDTGLICGGTLEIFVEPILPKPQLCLFGGGHVSLALARIADQAGFEITVVDDRESFANLQRFPMAAGVHTSFEASFEKLHPNPSTYVVIVTRGHKDDMRVLKWAVGTDARYIGMIGSKRKVIAVFRALEREGIPIDTFARVHAPIGLDIGAQTPEEIAVSIVAELIAERRQAAGSIHHKTVQVAGKAASTAASD
jgi:xanthine dehydrogenase accessory factor